MKQALIVALLLALPALCAAQEAAVPKPEVKVGDSWTYQRLGRKSNQPGRSTTRVTFVNERVIQTLTGNEGDETWTTDWNAVSTRSGNVYLPEQALLRFPLRAGDSYPVVYETKAPRSGTGAAHSRHERTAKVVGWEEVQVPAGKFRALKIEVDGPFYRIDAGFSGSAKHVIWYVPSVKRWVKLTYEDSTPRGGYFWSGEELVSYKVKK